LVAGSSAAEARAAAERSGYRIPPNYVAERASNNKGWVFRAPETQGNANIVRVEEPDEQNPTGAVRYYNSYGQPLNAQGKPGPNEETHLPLRPGDEDNPEAPEEPLDPLSAYYTAVCGAGWLA
jgi:hypothetical protein